MGLQTTRRCMTCDHRYDVITHRGETLTIDLPEGDNREVCPNCEGAEWESVIFAPTHTDSDSRWYNGFDNGLGQRIYDKQHHRQVCQELGVTRGEFPDSERELSRRKSRRERVRGAIRADHEKRMATDPDYRRIVARGSDRG